MRTLLETPSQTAGPYVHIGLVPERAGLHRAREVCGPNLLAGISAEAATSGGFVKAQPIIVEGRVIDASSSAVLDAVVELWQADHQGSFADASGAGFRGWGRSAVHPVDAMYRFFTIKPGAVSALGGRLMAPHLALWIVARGINLGLHTRMYFPEDADHHREDPVLRTVELAVRRATLVGRLVTAQQVQSESAPAVHDVQSPTDLGGPGTAFAHAPRYRFDIVLQGPDETVFFDV